MRTSRNRPTSLFRLSPIVAALAALAAPAQAAIYLVNDSGNTTGPTTPLNCAAGSTCSLHQAMQAAVSACDPAAEIRFNLASPFTISPSFALPSVGHQCDNAPAAKVHITINGYSQAGSSPNGAAVGFDGTNLVVLDGGSYNSFSCPLSTSTFSYGEGALAVTGLVIRNFTYGSAPPVCGQVKVTGNKIHNNVNGVDIHGSGSVGGAALADRNVIRNNSQTGVSAFNSAVSIVNNYIGVGDSGTGAQPNQYGISLSGAGGSQITNNVISGNSFTGLSIDNSPGAVVSNNAIGTDASRTAAIPNGTGIDAGCSNNLQIQSNVISGNSYGGVYMTLSDAVQFTSNKIGVAADGATPLPNGGDALFFDYGGLCGGLSFTKAARAAKAGVPGGSNGLLIQNNVIAHNSGKGINLAFGGDADIINNDIHNNGSFGVRLMQGTGNRISLNEIYDNVGKNIDLDFYGGALPNDDGSPPTTPPDLDTGPNNRQNYPIVNQVTWVGGNTHVNWTLRSTPGVTHEVEFFENNVAGVPAGRGYHTFAPPILAVTDSNGFFSQTTVVPGNHDFIAMTAIDPAGNTSEFSPAVALTPTPAVNVTMSPSTFPTTEVGASSAPMVITLDSVGTAPYVVTQLDSSPSCYGGPICSSGAFTCSSFCTLGNAYSPGSSCHIDATFAPTVPGTSTTVFYVCDNAPGSPRAITLTANGIAPPPSTLLPASHDFGSVGLGGFSSYQAFTVHNPAATSVALSAFTSTGPFALANNTCAGSLAPMASCTVDAKFVPAATGAATGALSITAGQSTLTAALSGTGTAPPPATLSPPSIDFGSVGVGFVSSVGVFTVNNPALVPVSLSSFTVTSPFVLHATTCTSSLSPSSSCTADVKFIPATTGPATGQISLDAGGVTVSSGLSGNGTAAAALSITPSTHDFGTVLVGNTPTKSFTIANPSASAATLSGPMVTGPFEITSTTCTSSLASLANCAANVRFVPPTNGTFAGQLSVASSGSTTSATLVGSGLLQSVLDMPTADIDLGATVVGASPLLRVITLRNTGNAALSIERIAVGAPFTLVNGCPVNLLPNESCQVTISFDPVALGSVSAALTVVTNAPGGSRSVPVRASVQARPEPVIRLSPQSIGFGDRMGNTSGEVTRRITIVNDGGSDAVNLGVSINTPHFLLSTNCPAVLAPASTCFADVTFQPIGYGPKRDTVSVTSNAPTATSSLSGAGCRPPQVTQGRVQRLNCAP